MGVLYKIMKNILHSKLLLKSMKVHTIKHFIGFAEMQLKHDFLILNLQRNSKKEKFLKCEDLD